MLFCNVCFLPGKVIYLQKLYLLTSSYSTSHCVFHLCSNSTGHTVGIMKLLNPRWLLFDHYNSVRMSHHCPSCFQCCNTSNMLNEEQIFSLTQQYWCFLYYYFYTFLFAIDIYRLNRNCSREFTKSLKMQLWSEKCDRCVLMLSISMDVYMNVLNLRKLFMLYLVCLKFCNCLPLTMITQTADLSFLQLCPLSFLYSIWFSVTFVFKPLFSQGEFTELDFSF